jgi:hypothetical protein
MRNWIIPTLALGMAAVSLGQTNDTSPRTPPARTDAMRATTLLRIGMRQVEAEKILKANGLVATGLGGSGHHYTVDYPLANGEMLRVTYNYKEPVRFPRTNETEWADDVLTHAGLWRSGNKSASADCILIGGGTESNSVKRTDESMRPEGKAIKEPTTTGGTVRR